MSESRWPRVRQWLAVAAALWLLNATLTFHNVWPTLWITIRNELSVELAAVVFALVGYAALGGTVSRGARIALTFLLLALAIGRYAEVTAPALYGRPVNLYWDAQHLPKVVAMLVNVVPPWLGAAGALGIAALLAAVVAALYWSVAQLTQGVVALPVRRVLGGAAAAVVAVYAVGRVFDLPTRHWYALPVAVAYRQQVEFLLDAYRVDTRNDLPITPLEPSDLGRVAGADVLLTFLESYGAIAYDLEQIATTVAPAQAEFAAAAAATDRRVVSAFFESPTFGGGSWLAHATVMSGFEVRDPGNYALLLTQRRQTISWLFTQAGYRTLAWMPGLRNEWPEGAFYAFEAIYGARDIDYRGPDFGWWRIPDQFALARLDARELRAPDRRPLFAFFPTINTHIPFLPAPPYQEDWQRLLGDAPFDEADVAASLAATPDWTQLREPYAESLRYTFEYLAAYLRERADLDVVLVLVGDHQPAASVTGVDVRWDVPVHVVTSRGRGDIADALLQFGFIEGMALAPRQAAIGTMPELTTLLLRAFDSRGALPAYGGALP